MIRTNVTLLPFFLSFPPSFLLSLFSLVRFTRPEVHALPTFPERRSSWPQRDGRSTTLSRSSTTAYTRSPSSSDSICRPSFSLFRYATTTDRMSPSFSDKPFANRAFFLPILVPSRYQASPLRLSPSHHSPFFLSSATRLSFLRFPSRFHDNPYASSFAVFVPPADPTPSTRQILTLSISIQPALPFLSALSALDKLSSLSVARDSRGSLPRLLALHPQLGRHRCVPSSKGSPVPIISLVNSR